jgi:hypothetical protein
MDGDMKLAWEYLVRCTTRARNEMTDSIYQPKEETTMTDTNVKYPALWAAIRAHFGYTFNDGPTPREYVDPRSSPDSALYWKLFYNLGGWRILGAKTKIQWLWGICCDQVYGSVDYSYRSCIPKRSDIGDVNAKATTLYYKLLDAITADLAPPVNHVWASSEKQQISAWTAVFNKLMEVNPDFLSHKGSGLDCAVAEIDRLAKLAALAPAPKPKVTLTRTLYLYRREGTGSTFISEGKWPTSTAKLLGSKTFTITEGDTPDAE